MWTTTRRLLGVLMMLAVITAACGSTASPTAETTTDAEHSDDEHANDEHSDGDHGAKTLDVNADAPTPGVEIALVETSTQGVFDLAVTLTNFTITPDAIDGDPVDNEGHMHLLIDGEKVERFTELERQVAVPAGEHLVEVELNANNHSAYAVEGTPIRAGLTVTGHGEAEASDGHSHSAGGSAIEEGLTTADANVSAMVDYANGDVTIEGGDRIDVSVGDIVSIMINSDVAEQAHLHGYDLIADVEPGESAMILFTANTPGKFEIEFETSGTFVAELVVS